MVECPSCHAMMKTIPPACSGCGFLVNQIDGFQSWAPDLAVQNTGDFFDLKKFHELASLESANFWFQARNELILWALKRHFERPSSIAEIGCGTGFVLSAIERTYPAADIVGTELFVEGLKFAAYRCVRAKLVQLDARQIPYRGEFDVVGIFDVLEHIEDDEIVLAQIEKALVAGGGLLITVPQHRWLWSTVDEAACHVRRYTAEELEKKVVAAGFEILRSTSFVSFLLPAMLAARMASRKMVQGARAELEINRVLNTVFRTVMAVEFQFIKLGINFPFGGSRLLVARKKSK